MKLFHQGGPGSGNRGHKGRPGQVGGSAKGSVTGREISWGDDSGLLNILKQISDMTNGRSTQGFIYRHGTEYEPQPCPKGIPKGTPSECYRNAALLALENDDFTYVEGVALPDFAPIPIEHAWVVDKKGRVIDNTWKTPGSEYIGIPISQSELSRMLVETEVYGLLGFGSPTSRKFMEDIDKNHKPKR